MAPKRQSSLKAAEKLTTKRRQQSKSPQKAAASSPKSSKKIASPKKRIISDLEKESALKELRAFDLTTKYGPCVGISRLERWERAEKYKKQPPARIIELLTDAALVDVMGTDATENLWFHEV